MAVYFINFNLYYLLLLICNAIENGKLDAIQVQNSLNPANLQSLTCDFETDFCGWHVLDEHGKSDWRRIEDSKVGPGTDHTSLIEPKPAKSGTWITSYQITPSISFDLSYLQSERQLIGSNTYCLSFWYYYTGFEVGQLAVFMSNVTGISHFSLPLWSRSIPQVRDWQQAFVEIPPMSKDYYLTIRSMVIGHVATGLDDIILSNTTCKIDTTRFCDFEVNTCNWVNVSGDFHREQANFGLVDHTTQTRWGHFLIDSHGSSTIRRNLNGLTFSHTGRHARKQPFCISLYYHIHTEKHLNDQSSYLKVTLVDSIIPDQVIVDVLKTVSIGDALNYGLTDQWIELRADFKSFKWEWLHIEVNRSVAKTEIALDDIRVSENVCQVQGNCDFENDMCGWINDYQPSELDNTAFLWTRIHPRTNYSKQQLSYDHTVGSQGKGGNYLLLPLEILHQRYTLLQSPLITRTTYFTCFRMYYFAQSNLTSIVAMKLSLVNLSTNKTFSEVLIKTTPMLEWTLFEFEVDNPPPYYYFVIKPLYNGKLNSDLGLDDIKIANEQCKKTDQFTSTTEVPPSEKHLECNFEQVKTCHWKWTDSVWNVTNYLDSLNLEKSGFYAPRTDHTYQSDSGHYLMLLPNVHYASTSKISLESTETLKSNTAQCLHLWYYADGEYSFLINISMINTVGQYQTIAQYSSYMENRVWQLLRVEMMYEPAAPQITPDYRVHIEVSPQNPSGQLDLFAVDDIAVYPGHCEHQFNYVYTFSQMLGMEDLELEHIQPVRSNTSQVYQPQSELLAQVPHVDHTTRTPDGSYYLFINQKDSYQTVYIDTLTMHNLPSDTTDLCVRFAYQAQGLVTFRVTVEQENDFKVDGVKMFEHKFSRDQWTVIEFNKRISYEHKLIYYFEKLYDNISFVAIDDVEILGYECQEPIDCDFQNNHYCSYSPFYDSKTIWYNFEVFTTPPEDPNYPGPKLDHTIGRYGGGYLLFSTYRLPKNSFVFKAKVISGPKLIKSHSDYCLSLWTQVTSNDSQLRISIMRYGKQWSDTNRTQLVVQHINETQTQWTLWTQTLDSKLLQNTDELQVSIEGWLPANAKGAIAIDDIALTLNACDNSGIICANGKPVLENKICNFAMDCPSGEDEIGCGECNFETDQCGWNDTNARWNDHWVRVMANENMKHTINSPTSDADGNKTGHYMMMHREMQAAQAHAQMALNFENPRMYLKQAYVTCEVSFDYYVNTSGQFYIQLKLGSDVNNLNTLFSILEYEQESWIKTNVHIGEHRSQFILDIDAYQEDPSGVVALDNFEFHNCATPHISKQNCRTTTPIQCPQTFICIDEDDLCDGTNNCGNEWDETDQQCSNRIEICTFNSLFACHITTDHNSNSRAQWNIAQAKSFEQDETVPGFEPLIDHTSGTKFGYYMLLMPQTDFYTASFYSPMLTSSSNQTCALRFFYFFHTKTAQSSKAQINMKIRFVGKSAPEEKPSLIWQSNSKNLQQWVKGVAQFASSKPFQFVFEGVLPDQHSRLAIDDLSYDANCHLYQSNFPYKTTQSPFNKPHESSKGPVVAGVLVTLLLIATAVSGFILYQRRRSRLAAVSTMTLSMKNIENRFSN